MTRQTIYAPSAELDLLASQLRAEAAAAKEKAKRLRWLEAPEWANCIAKPSFRTLEQMEKGSCLPRWPSDPTDAEDWRWARRTSFGWFNFDAEGEVRSAAEAGTWTIQEYRE